MNAEHNIFVFRLHDDLNKIMAEFAPVAGSHIFAVFCYSFGPKESGSSWSGSPAFMYV